MRYLDQLFKYFINRPRVQSAGPIDYRMEVPAAPVSRIPLYVRIYLPGERLPYAVVPVHEVLSSDYKAAKYDGGFVAESEQEGSVSFCCILPVHVDNIHASSKSEEPRKTAGRRSPPPPGTTAEALAG